MKKFIFMFAATLAISVFMTSCGGEQAKETTSKTAVTEETTTDETTVTEETKTTADYSAGKAIYEGKGTCHTCHGAEGLGTPGVFPPLAKSDYLATLSTEDLVKQTLYGSSEAITVNGMTYPGSVMGGAMNNVVLSEQEVADVVNYVTHSWGNNFKTVTVEDVKAIKK